ncbi:ACR family transporter [Chimaeribacter coloradensis]|uniref:ACR family transporter n=1 Tax=Chimaeribacter coloradensis TaxID=2060068 RepID=A0A2N5E3Z5_9GAMM|nr:efflux RND transporter permease subunit [Chimaeribacter coloradensis]PLR35562.1 ACR family transporter [Chimaeribacter coloradensis]
MQKNKFNLSTWAIEHQQIVSFVLLMIMSIGYLCYVSLPRDEDPAFTIKTAVISAQWNGATPPDMVNHVTDQIEKTAQALPFIDSIESQTRRGFTEVTVNLKDETPPDQVKPAWALLRKKMHDLAPQLPEGVGEPAVNDEYDATYGTIYGITAEGYSDRQLRDSVEAIQKALLTVPDIGRTQLLGVQDEQITLSFSPRHLALMGLSPETLVSALRSQNAVTPSGELRTDKDIIDISVTGALSTVDRLKDEVITLNGKAIPLTSLVSIVTEAPHSPKPVFHVNGTRAAGIAIAMAPGGNMLEFGNALDDKMAALQATMPVGMKVTKVADQSAVVEKAVSGFTHVLTEAIVIVLAVSFVSLGLRAGLVVAVAIPVVLAMTFAGMALAGIGLQRISLGALIIALGLLVDDAMITIESMVSSLERGETLKKAASSAFTTTAFPMLTGTLVMIAGFIPVGFARSAAGEYCYSLFMVVLISLLSSWVVAVLFSPLSGVWLLPKKRSHPQHTQGRLATAYAALLRFSLTHKLSVVLCSCMLLLASIWASQWLKTEFFPASDRPELLVSLALPEGTTQQETQRVTEKLETFLAKEQGLARYTSYIGTGAIRFYLPMDVQSEAENKAQVIVVAKSLEARFALQERLTTLLNERFHNCVTRVSPLEMGPPVGWPIKYRVEGQDSKKVGIYAQQLAQVLAGNNHIRDINMTSGEPQRAIVVDVDQTKARAAGLTTENISQALNLYYSGNEITKIRNHDRLTALVLRAGQEEQQDTMNLAGMLLRNSTGANIPLAQVASVTWGLESPVIERRNRAALITVQADVTPGENADEVNGELAEAMGVLSRTLPPGYMIAESGASEGSDKGNSSLFDVLPVTLACMLGVMMLQLQSYSRVVLAAMMAPFGFVGVVIALVPTGTPLGFVAILGVIALSGMIIRNAIIMISEVDNNIRRGMGVEESVTHAALHRSRPIMLTACAAIFGMVPIARQVFWGPMAYAIIGGLVAATAFTLTLLPVLMMFLLNSEEKRARKRSC